MRAMKGEKRAMKGVDGEYILLRQLCKYNA